MYDESNEVSSLVADATKYVMSRPYGSRSAKVALGQSLLGLAGGLDADHGEERREKTNSAFRKWIRHGESTLNAEERQLLERRDMSSGGSGAFPGGGTLASSAIVPLDFANKVESAMKYAGPLQSLASELRTDDGRLLPYPSDNDTSQDGEWLVENQPATEQDVAQIGQVILGANVLSSQMVKVSRSLAEDAGFDLDTYLAQRLGVRLGRGLEKALATGTGTGQPTGVIAAASSAGIAVGASANDGSSAANSLGTADFATLEAAVDPAYRTRAVWMMHPNTLQKCRAQLDREGRPVFPGLQNSADGRNRIFNYEIALNPWMDQLQTQSSSPQVVRNVLAFGDFSKYVLRRGPSMLIRLWQRFAEYRQIAYIYLTRVDGNLIDGGGGAVKILQTQY